MEFWGVEVKAGESLKVQPEFGKLIHISQAALGEAKDVKGAKYVPLRLKIDDKKFVIGSLSAEDRTQMMFDLVFEKEFEISHDWKNGSVYFLGYTADEPASDDEGFSSDDFEADSEDEPVDVKEHGKENGTVKAKSADVEVVEGGRAGGKAKAGTKKEEEPKSDDDEDDDESDSDDEMALDGLQQEDSGDDSEDEGDSSDEEEEELPKAKQSKKRSAEPLQKTPAPKKSKSVTPDKTGKKGKTTTPVPSKSAGKDAKSGGQLSCKSCSKTFTSDNALQSHTKAKHGK